MIHTWLADVSALHNEDTYQRYYAQVPQFRKEKADHLQLQEDKALSVGAWILLEQMKKEYGLQEHAVFNISHSGTYALCSVDTSEMPEREVGCDLELIKKDRRGMAERYFCSDECAMIHTKEDFYRFWVLKESFVKAIRIGMKLPMDSYEFTFSAEGRPYLKRQPERFPKTYYFKEYEVEGLEYKIAVCADCDAFASDIKIMKL